MPNESATPRMNGEGPSLTKLLRFVRSTVPENQKLGTARPDMTVGEAAKVMLENGYSQLPVELDGREARVFSFRSLVAGLMRNPNLGSNCLELPTSPFLEKWRCVGPDERWESILENLNSDNGVLVRWPDNRLSIVTTMDVVQFLTDIATSFMILAEIELAVRRLINACIPSEELEVCMHTALGDRYSPNRMPKSLDEMAFGDYVLFFSNSRNWKLFSPALGEHETLHQDAVDRLDLVRLMRNDVFHFKRRLTPAEEQRLAEERDWLENTTVLAESKCTGKRKTPWDRESFTGALKGKKGKNAVSIAERILEWAEQRQLTVKWGEGRTVASFHLKLEHGERSHFVFSVWSSGGVQMPFWRYAWSPQFESEENRKELLARVKAIPEIALPDEPDKASKGEPYFDILCLGEAQALEAFLNVFEWFLQRVQRAEQDD